jgi:hypothetical protein
MLDSARGSGDTGLRLLLLLRGGFLT